MQFGDDYPNAFVRFCLYRWVNDSYVLKTTTYKDFPVGNNSLYGLFLSIKRHVYFYSKPNAVDCTATQYFTWLAT
jgi:hypothetical protein